MPKSEEALEADLAKAKEEYRGDPDNTKAKDGLAKAKRALVEVRSARRSDVVTIGGDAVISYGSEG